MKFKIQSSELLEHLLNVGKVVNSRPSLSILENVLLSIVNDTTATLCGSDLDTTMVTTLTSISVEESGVKKVCISCKRLTDIIKEFPIQPLIFSLNEETLMLEITSSKGTYNIPAFDGNDYPTLPSLTSDHQTISVSSSIFLEGINRTLFAAASEELRPIVNGLNISTKSGMVTFNATDSHKLISYKRNDLKVQDQGDFVLPKKPAALLKTLLQKDESSVNIRWDRKNVEFSTSVFQLYSRLIEGIYPNFESVIPQNNDNKIVVDRLEILSSLRLVSQFSPIGTNLIRLELSDNSLVISAQDLDFSLSASERVHCVYEGTSMQIGFKSTLLMDILSNLVTTEVEIKLGTPDTSAIIIPNGEDKDIEETTSIVMPLMLG